MMYHAGIPQNVRILHFFSTFCASFWHFQGKVKATKLAKIFLQTFSKAFGVDFQQKIGIVSAYFSYRVEIIYFRSKHVDNKMKNFQILSH